MNQYNYLGNETEDIIQYIQDNHEVLDDYRNDATYDSFSDYLNDRLWVEDSVTGNGSGSYTFNANKAELNLLGNWDLLKEAAAEVGSSLSDLFDKGPETCDVTIRCYLLSQAINAALEQLQIHD